MPSILTPFGEVKERDFPMASCFTNRKSSKEITKEFDDVSQRKSQAATTLISKFELKIHYGDRKKQTLDVFYPEQFEEDTEIVVYFHGGYWQEGCTDSYRFLAPSIVRAGKICILVGKDLAPFSSVEFIGRQCKKALCFIAQKFPNTSAITLFGHSSGGQECTMLLSEDWRTYDPEMDLFLKAKLRRVVSICGIFELTHLLDTAVNEVTNMMWDEAIACSPIAHVKQLTVNLQKYQCQFIFITVEHDTPTILKWNRVYEKELKAMNVDYKHIFLQGLDHFNVILKLDEEDSIMTQYILNND